MGLLYIRNDSSDDFTFVSNCFLDKYMPEANGEFVKIYLYLLRAMSDRTSQFSLLSIADTLNCTEKDIERALKYWCKKGILKLEFDEHKQIAGIILLPLVTPNPGTVTPASVSTEASLIPSAVSTEASLVPAPSPETLTAAAKEAEKPQRTLTPSKVKELKKNEEIIQLLFIAEQYLGKTLSPTETNRLLYFYEELGFSADLIEYLIEYCVSKGSKSIRYIEKVALAWHEANITTVDAAKQESNTYHRNYFSILKAFGISSRNPVDSEIQIMNRWLKEYVFTLDIIMEACNRTITQTGKPSFRYADQILHSWHQKKVVTLDDIAKLDNQHKKTKENSESAPAKAKSPNKFNNFSQRDYNFNDLEKQLLKK